MPLARGMDSANYRLLRSAPVNRLQLSVTSFPLRKNYVNLNIGLKLTLEQSVAYFVEWVFTGTVIGLIYPPAVPH